MKTGKNVTMQSGRRRMTLRQEHIMEEDTPDSSSGAEYDTDLEEDDTPDCSSGAEYDTDLEEDEVKVVTERVQKLKISEQENEGVGHVTYRTMCKSLGTLPIRKVIDQLHAREMRLQHVGLNNSDCKAIACALLQNTCIEALDLQDNGLQGEDLVPIVNILKTNTQIRQLSVSENEIDVLAAMAVDDVLRVTSVLTKLNLSGTRIGDREAEYIAAGIQHNSSLLWLDLSHNNIGIEGAKKLGRALGDVDCIQFLDISWNHIRLAGAVALLKGVKMNRSIVDLNLSMNGLGYEGSLALEETLKENTCLRLLDVSNNRINWEGVVYVARGLRKNSTLKILKMGDNPLNMEGCCVLMKAVTSRRCKLEHIGLENVPVNGAVLCLVQEVLKTRHFTLNHGGLLDTRDVIGIRKEKPEDPISLVVRYLAMMGIRVIDMFRMFDIDNDGEVSKSEFIKGMKKIGIPLKDTALKEVAGRLDRGKKGVISYSILVHGVRNHMRAERKEDRRVELKERMKIQHQRRILQTTLPPIYKSSYEDDALLYAVRSNASIGARRSFASSNSRARGSLTSQTSDTSMGSNSDLRSSSQILSKSFENMNSFDNEHERAHAHTKEQSNSLLVPLASHGHRLSVTEGINQSANTERRKSFLWLKYINLYLERRRQQAARFSNPALGERRSSTLQTSFDGEYSNRRRASRIDINNDLTLMERRKTNGDIENRLALGAGSRRQTQPSIYVGTDLKTERKFRRGSVAQLGRSNWKYGKNRPNAPDNLPFAGTKLLPTLED